MLPGFRAAKIRPLAGRERRRRREQWAVGLTLATVLGLGIIFAFGTAPGFLMPGPLASAHGAIESCSTCHAKSGSGALTWLSGLVAGEPLADSKACLTCHTMPETAFNAHGASAHVLGASGTRLSSVAAKPPVPLSSHAQNTAFPTEAVAGGGLFCATCHQEHRGAEFKLAKISNEQCHSCHQVKFDSFDGHHPEFDSYPFRL